MAEQPYKNKLRDSILTNQGRQLFLAVGNGVGKLVYTRATLSSQKMTDSSGNFLDNESMANLTKLQDDLKEGELQITPVVDNHFSVIANFSNKNQPNDISFSVIGWYARVDTEKDEGKEALIAVTPTNANSEILAAASPDGLSSQVISAELDMTISNAAKIDMTVNEIGYITRAELNTWQTKVEGDINSKFEQQSKTLTITINGKTPTKAENNTFDLDTYDKKTIDKMVAGAGKGAGINTVQGVAPDDKGNVDLGSMFYSKQQVDTLTKELRTKVTSLQSSNTDKDTQITSLNNQITGLNNQINDLLNRVKYLEERDKFYAENAGLIHKFTNEADAKAWAAKGANYIGTVQDTDDATVTTS